MDKKIILIDEPETDDLSEWKEFVAHVEELAADGYDVEGPLESARLRLRMLQGESFRLEDFPRPFPPLKSRSFLPSDDG